MSAASAEAAVLNLLIQHNKPFSLQNVVDLLAHVGLKKAQVTKALDSLADSNKITAKEFGKTKLYIPKQSDLSVLSREDTEAKKSEAKELQETYQKEAGEIKELEQELQGWKSSLTDDEIEVQINKLTSQLTEQAEKIEKLSSGVILVSPEERLEVEKKFALLMESWRKRKSIFKNIWGAISEGLDGKQSDLFEEIGVDTDEAIGVSLAELERLSTTKKRRF